MKHPEKGMKVSAQIKGIGTHIPAVVLESKRSDKGKYYDTKLRIAQKAELPEGWIINDYEEPVQSYKLTRRHTVIPELDRVEL